MDDLISRQAAIDALNGQITVSGIENAKAIQEYIRSVALKIRDLPSAERKTGRWRMQVNPKRECYGHWECYECGTASWEKTNYCSHCGARMEEEDGGGA